MSKKVKTDWGEVNEPNIDDSLSKFDIYRLKSELSKVLSANPNYKTWIYAVEFKRETFHKNKYVYMYVYLNNVGISHMDVLEMEKKFLEENELFDSLLYNCEVLGSLGYIESNTDNWIFIQDFVMKEIRNNKIDSILR